MPKSSLPTWSAPVGKLLSTACPRRQIGRHSLKNRGKDPLTCVNNVDLQCKLLLGGFDKPAAALVTRLPRRQNAAPHRAAIRERQRSVAACASSAITRSADRRTVFDSRGIICQLSPLCSRRGPEIAAARGAGGH